MRSQPSRAVLHELLQTHSLHLIRRFEVSSLPEPCAGSLTSRHMIRWLAAVLRVCKPPRSRDVVSDSLHSSTSCTATPVSFISEYTRSSVLHVGFV
jgi:hypothetical protein